MKNLSLIICLTISALFGSGGGVFASDLLKCPSSGYFDNCFGTYTAVNGDKIVGEWKNDKVHGQGSNTYANGDKYVGEYKDGKRNGLGTFTFADGDKYVGQWKDDEYNGQGTYTFADGTKEVGEFKDGKLNGYAVQYSSDGSILKEGIWQDDEFQYAQNNPSLNSDGTFSSALPSCPSDTSVRWHNCFGAYTFDSDSDFAGDKYVGEWKDDEFNGQGTYTFADGDKIVGEWKNGNVNGQGTYTYANGDKYVGEFKDDKRNGQGTYTYANGDKYVGEFKDDKLNGYAVQYSSDGSILKEGIWKDDEFQYAQANSSANSDEISSSALPSCPTDPSVRWHDCFGAYTFDSDSDWAGDKYVGEWKDDKRNGQGTYTYANGDKYVGGYKDNQRHGQGNFTFGPNSEWVGDEYFGEYKNDQHHGQGTYTYANGEKYVGEFKDGVFNGQGTFTWGPNSEWAGDKYVGDFKDDKKQGQGTYTWANGDKYVGEFKDDASNGQGTYTFADGSVKEGIWKDWEFQYAQGNPSPAPEVETTNQDDEVISASSGSGFAVSYDGYVITNHHVIDGCEKVVIHTKEDDFTVKVVTYDPQNDLALLKGDFNPPTVFPLSNTRPELLQDIYVAGFPFGDMFSTSVKGHERDYQFSYRFGKQLL